MSNIYVLVHGAWQGGWIWEKVTPLLEEKGHIVHAVDLPGHGRDKRDPAAQDLESYARDLAGRLEQMPRPVVLVGHSLGGMTISQAACYAPGKVKELIYICAFLPRDGQSADGGQDGIKPTDWAAMAAQGKGVTLADGGKTSIMDPVAAAGMVMNCLPQQEALQHTEKFTRQPLAAQYQAVKLCGEFYSIPKTYIRCLQDMITPLEKQDKMAADSAVENVYTLDTDHSPFFSAPRELADILLEQ